MNKSKIFGGLVLMLVIGVSVTLASFAYAKTGVSKVYDCKKDLKCFLAKLKTCTPTKFVFATTTILGSKEYVVEVRRTSTSTIKGYKSGKCSFDMTAPILFADFSKKTKAYLATLKQEESALVKQMLVDRYNKNYSESNGKIPPSTCEGGKINLLNFANQLFKMGEDSFANWSKIPKTIKGGCVYPDPNDGSSVTENVNCKYNNGVICVRGPQCFDEMIIPGKAIGKGIKAIQIGPYDEKQMQVSAGGVSSTLPINKTVILNGIRLKYLGTLVKDGFPGVYVSTNCN